MAVTSSIVSKVSKIKTDIGLIRDKLITLGVATSTDKLTSLVTKVQNISDYTKHTNTGKTVSGTYQVGSGGVIYATPEKGYYLANSMISVGVPNLQSSNIRSGTNVGGVVGSYTGAYPTYATVTFDLTHRVGSSTTNDPYIVAYDSWGDQIIASKDSSYHSVIGVSGPILYVSTTYAYTFSGTGCRKINSTNSSVHCVLLTSTTASIRVTK